LYRQPNTVSLLSLAGALTTIVLSPVLVAAISSVGTALVIQRDEEHVPATVVELSFYDPRRARIRI
jgi:hypothetical protein